MTSPTIAIFTYKEPGRLLSVVAHDLRLRIDAVEVEELDASRVRTVVDLRKLRAEGAMRSGSLDPRALRDADLRKIERNALDEVLEVHRHPQAVFEGTREDDEGSVRLEGRLELHGQTRDLRLHARPRGDALVARVEIVPSRWGIRPYRAFAGTLRLQDRVTLEISVPRPSRG